MDVQTLCGALLELSPFPMAVLTGADHSILDANSLFFEMFEGSAEQMYHSLQKLARLPAETALYCGHEYTLSNGRFAMKVDPSNKALAARMHDVETLRAQGQFTLPSTIGRECDTNPFLRADQPDIAKTIGMEGQPAVAVFAKLREMKNKA